MFGETRNTKLVNIFEKIANKHKVFQSKQSNKKSKKKNNLISKRSKTQIQNMLEMSEIFKRDFSKKFDNTNRKEILRKTTKPSKFKVSATKYWNETLGTKDSNKNMLNNESTKKSLELFQIYNDEDDDEESMSDEFDSNESEQSEIAKNDKFSQYAHWDLEKKEKTNSRDSLLNEERSNEDNLLNHKNLGEF
jgi:hypothetical protein